MPNVISVNPFRCRVWERHARLEEHNNEKTCQAEINSFGRYGQMLPAIGRPVRSDLSHDYEIVCGARRLFVARHLNVPLLLDLRELTDREAIVALDIENRQREDLSPYERGVGYNRWLRSGLFASQDDLAKTLGISASQVSRLMRLAALPSVIVSAFPSPLDICERWGRNLMDLWDQPHKRAALTTVARGIAKEPNSLSAVDVFRSLVAAPSRARGDATNRKLDVHDEVIKDDDGSPLFRVRRHRNDTALLLPSSSVPNDILAEIKREVAAILHRAKLQTIDFNGQCRAVAVPESAITANFRQGSADAAMSAPG